MLGITGIGKTTFYWLGGIADIGQTMFRWLVGIAGIGKLRFDDWLVLQVEVKLR